MLVWRTDRIGEFIMDLYIASTYSAEENSIFKILDIYVLGYSRLLSYEYHKSYVDNLIRMWNLWNYFLQEKDGGQAINLSSQLYGNRLFSFITDKSRIERFLEALKNMDIYMAGDTSGFDSIKPEKIIDTFNVLLSYEHPKGKDSTDKIIDRKKEVINDALPGRSRKGTYIR